MDSPTGLKRRSLVIGAVATGLGLAASKPARARRPAEKFLDTYRRIAAPPSVERPFEMLGGYRLATDKDFKAPSAGLQDNLYVMDYILRHQDGDHSNFDKLPSAADIKRAEAAHDPASRRLAGWNRMLGLAKGFENPLMCLQAVGNWFGIVQTYDMDKAKLSVDAGDKVRSRSLPDFLKTGSGICDDFSIAEARTLRLLFPKADIGLVGLAIEAKNGELRERHAVVAIKLDNKTYIHDTTGLSPLQTADDYFSNDPGLEVKARPIALYGSRGAGIYMPNPEGRSPGVANRAVPVSETPHDTKLYETIIESATNVTQVQKWIPPRLKSPRPPK